ncbi:MAG: hypothetical protein GSR76_00660 [Desulfurococcales archaeon]|nr:hypothetical protein [Desulfurococcales archaeon]MEB3799142.1 hypothetical protein [Desulfurococcales archaeon]
MAKKVISTVVDEETYKLLKRKAELKGYRLLSDYLRFLIERDLSEEEQSSSDILGELEDLLNKKLSRIERTVADLLNPYTGKIDRIITLVTELKEELEQSRETMAQQEPASFTQEARQPSEQKKPLVSYRKEQTHPPRKTAIERLKEEGAVYESDLGWLKRPDLFFSKLEREGAIVFEAGEERVAVDPEFLNELKSKLREINIPEAESVEKLLRPQEARLFRLLVDSGRAYFDSVEGGWFIEL